ncbi:C6 transcription factor [Phlyctema vagabunda]|uniref:C6 transcription factor n=1 Tax=Phlyctema vagabunda TaxID=108571 RepID=A0ABR4PTU5_9HELO
MNSTLPVEADSKPLDSNPINSKRKRQTPAQLAARVARACDRCRGRKYKCDGGHPCTSCNVNNQTCTYDPVLRRRGLPEGYVRGLERLLGLAISRDKSFEELVVSIAHDGHDDDYALESPPDGWNVEKMDEKLHESWKRSNVSSQMENLIPILESFESKGWKRRRVEQGENPADPKPQFEPPQELSSYPAYVRPEAVAPMVSPVGAHRRAQSGYFRPLSVPPGADLKTLQALTFKLVIPSQLPERAGRLLDSYFTFTHCWLPFIERHDLLRLSYRYSEISGTLSPNSLGTGEIAALWALLAYTDHPTVDSSTPMSPLGHDNITTEQLYGAAKALIPSERSGYELGHVQALLLMVLYNMRYACLDAAWMHIGQAVRIAIILGLDKPTAPLELVDQGRKVGGRDTHVFLACFVLDTLLAARLNRLPHLRKDSLLHVGPLFEDGPEEWEPWVDSQTTSQAFTHFRNPSFITSTFNRLIEVLVVLNEVICDKSLGSQWEAKHSLLRARLADSAAQFKSRSQRQIQHPLPHHTVLHLLHISTLVYMRLHALSQPQNKQSPSSIVPMSAQLTSQLQQCLNVFGPVQYPPLLGFSALLALKEDETFSIQPTAETSAWKEQLLEIAIKLEVRNSGFREIQNAIALSKFAAITQPNVKLADPLPTTSYISESANQPRHFWNTPVQDSPHARSTRSDSIVGSHHATSVSHSDVNRFDGTIRMPSAHTPTNQSKPMSGGEFGDIGPFETATAIIAETPSPVHTDVHNEVDVSKEDFKKPWTAPETPGGDSDAAFLSLAHLDTTQWSSNWEDGLAELGFANDSMFREFCNDPDRLFSDDGA